MAVITRDVSNTCLS